MITKTSTHGKQQIKNKPEWGLQRGIFSESCHHKVNELLCRQLQLSIQQALLENLDIRSSQLLQNYFFFQNVFCIHPLVPSPCRDSESEKITNLNVTVLPTTTIYKLNIMFQIIVKQQTSFIFSASTMPSTLCILYPM